MKVIKFSLIVLLTVVAVVMGNNLVYADELAPVWRGGPQIGISPYTGVLGVEIQRGPWAVTVGAPMSVGLRYYLGEDGTQWFLGAHAMWFDTDDDETKDGILYTEKDNTLAGVGFGYKWRWKKHWDLILSLSAVYYEEELKGLVGTRTEKFVGLFPGLSIGYTF